MLGVDGLVESAADLAGELRVAQLAGGLEKERVPFDAFTISNAGVEGQRGSFDAKYLGCWALEESVLGLTRVLAR